MSFILEAFSPADGMAIVHTGQRLRLIRPPYKQANAIELPESAIQDAVLNHDFHASGIKFDSWQTVIAFLNQQLAEYRQNHGRLVAESFSNLEILDVAPLEVLQGFLNKVENELIPNGQLEHAENFLSALLESSVAQKHPHLTIQAAKLWKKIRQVEDCKKVTANAYERKYNPFKCLERKNLIGPANKKADYIQRYGFFGSATQES